MRITRSASVADQVNQILHERIRLGVYPPGGKLPSESELSNDFEVSRATIRTVLAKIAAEGLIIRKQGNGTYVNERIGDVNTHLGGLWEFGRLIESCGYKPAIKALSVVKKAATEEDARTLSIEPGDPVLQLKRLFLADLKPVILATNVIDYSLLDQSEGPPDGHLPISEFIQRYCHQRIAYAISDVQAIAADNEFADILHQEQGAPLLRIKITLYDRDNFPLISGHSFFDDKTLRLRLVQAWE